MPPFSYIILHIQGSPMHRGVAHEDTALHLRTHLLTPLLRLVLETLKPLPTDRKCFRLINGVLIERTVADVVPALQTNSEGLKKVLGDLVKQYNKQQEEMEKWKKKNNIQVVQQ